MKCIAGTGSWVRTNRPRSHSPRVVVHVPNWVLMDGTLSSMPDELLERVAEAFDNELRYTGVVHIGPVAQVVDHLFGRSSIW